MKLSLLELLYFKFSLNELSVFFQLGFILDGFQFFGLIQGLSNLEKQGSHLFSGSSVACPEVIRVPWEMN